MATSASQKGIMDKAWEVIQKKTFTKWVNNHLVRRHGANAAVKDIQNDLQDGIAIMRLINALYDLPMRKHNANPKLRVHLIENVNQALNMVHEAGVKTVFLSAENIVDCELKMVLGMIWTIILHYQIQGISVEELNAKEGLLLWCKKKTAGYRDVQVDNFHLSFQDGLAFCALIHKHRPDLLDFNSLKKDNKAENLNLAFEIAETKLGIPRLLEVDDMINVPRPDERSVMTYVSEYFHYFASQNQAETAGRRIAKLAKATQQNEKLKSDYLAAASDLINWIKSTTNSLNQRDFDNTLPGILAKISEFESFKKNTKPPKTSEKIEVEQIYNNLAMKLRGAGRPPFQPPAGLSVQDINHAWDTLEEAERARDQALRDELARQGKLDTLLKRFNNKVGALEEFAKAKENFLKTGEGEKFDSVSQVQLRAKMLDGLFGELETSKKRLQDVNSLGAEIAALNYKDINSINNKLAELGGRWGTLEDTSRKRQVFYAEEIKRQQKMEDLRLEFARLAKEYNRWLKDAQAKARDENFGLSLAAVQGFQGTLNQEETELKNTSHTKKQALEKLDGELKALGVTFNNYTPFTVADLAARETELFGFLQKRQTAYQAELARQLHMEEKRKEFAAKANAFIAFLAQQRNQLSSVEGDPDHQITQVKSLFKDGSEGQAHLAELGALDAEMNKLGITENKHTEYSYRICQTRFEQHKQFVDNLLASLEEDVKLNNKLLELRKAWEKKQHEENLRIDFANNANELNAFFQNAHALLNDPVATNSVEQAQGLKAEFDSLEAEKGAKQGNLNNVRSLQKELHAAGVTENPLAELTAAQVEEKWSGVESGSHAYASKVDAEIKKQQSNEALRKEFANQAQSLNQFMDTSFSQMSSAENKEPEVELATLKEKIPVVENSRGQLEALRGVYNQLLSAQVSDNKYTNLTFPNVEVKWNQLNNSLHKKIQLLEAQISAKKASGVSAEQAQEFKECFAHFDRNQDGIITKDELKACLNSVGEFLSDEQLDLVIKEHGSPDGTVPYEGFQNFMLKRVSDNDTEHDIVEAFKVLAGDKPYVTEVSLRPVFDNETLAYLLKSLPPYPGVPGAYDFNAWVNTAYHK